MNENEPKRITYEQGQALKAKAIRNITRSLIKRAENLGGTGGDPDDTGYYRVSMDEVEAGRLDPLIAEPNTSVITKKLTTLKKHKVGEGHRLIKTTTEMGTKNEETVTQGYNIAPGGNYTTHGKIAVADDRDVIVGFPNGDSAIGYGNGKVHAGQHSDRIVGHIGGNNSPSRIALKNLKEQRDIIAAAQRVIARGDRNSSEKVA